MEEMVAHGNQICRKFAIKVLKKNQQPNIKIISGFGAILSGGAP